MSNQPTILDAAIDETEADRLFASQVTVVAAAERAIVTRMDRGFRQGYCPDSWKAESIARHVHRAVKHAITHLEIAAGDREDDGEDHLSAAVCRMAMALAISNPPSKGEPQ